MSGWTSPKIMAQWSALKQHCLFFEPGLRWIELEQLKNVWRQIRIRESETLYFIMQVSTGCKVEPVQKLWHNDHFYQIYNNYSKDHARL